MDPLLFLKMTCWCLPSFIFLLKKPSFIIKKKIALQVFPCIATITMNRLTCLFIRSRVKAMCTSCNTPLPGGKPGPGNNGKHSKIGIRITWNGMIRMSVFLMRQECGLKDPGKREPGLSVLSRTQCYPQSRTIFLSFQRFQPGLQ